MTDLKGIFERDGYLVVDDFFDTGLMLSLDQLIRSYFGDNPDFLHNDEFLDKAQTDVIPWFPQNEGVQAFDAIDEDDRLQALSTAILGESWVSQYSMVMFSKQGTSGQAWHQAVGRSRQAGNPGGGGPRNAVSCGPGTGGIHAPPWTSRPRAGAASRIAGGRAA